MELKDLLSFGERDFLLDLLRKIIRAEHKKQESVHIALTYSRGGKRNNIGEMAQQLYTTLTGKNYNL